MLWLVLALVALPPDARATEDEERQRLEAALTSRPEDVDLLLELAQVHARAGRRAPARALAQRVTERAPEYWDAHVLLARLDAWDGRYAEALDRLERVLAAVPRLSEALHLRADVELWSGALVDARSTLQALVEREQSAELYYRLAQVEYERMHYWASWEATGRALELDPLHARARALREEIVLVRADLLLEVERLPLLTDPWAQAEILAITLLPSAFLSFSLTHELRHRFGTWNQLLAAELGYRISRRLRVGAMGGFGAPAPVLSKSIVGGWAALELLQPLDVRLGYRYDRIALPGDLHRVSIDAGLRLPLRLRAELGYTLAHVQGVGAEAALLHGARAGLYFEADRLGAQLEYAAGSQVDRPVAALLELETHDFNLGFRYETHRWLALMAGLGLQLRRSELTQGEALRMSLGARLSL